MRMNMFTTISLTTINKERKCSCAFESNVLHFYAENWGRNLSAREASAHSLLVNDSHVNNVLLPDYGPTL